MLGLSIMIRSAPAPSVIPLCRMDEGDPCLHCTVRHLAVCAALNEQEMQALQQITLAKAVPNGARIARMGETRNHVYTVTEGALRLVRTLADGRRQVSGFVLPGDYLGLGSTGSHRFDVEAIVDSRVCRAPFLQMQELCQHYPHMEHKLLQRACEALDMAQDNALALARLQPLERLADFLLRLAAREAILGQASSHIWLPMGRSDIADHLGLTVETVSRTFSRLRQQEIISMPHLNKVEVLNFCGLQKLACEGSNTSTANSASASSKGA